MKYTVLLFVLFLQTTVSLQAQLNDKDIYFFDDFKDGTVNFRNGSKSKEKLNFNFFYNQLCFLDSRTDMIMIVRDVENIANIEIDGKMYYIDGRKFFEILNTEPLIQVQYKKSARRVKTAAYGGTSETSSVDSYIPINQVWKRNEGDFSNIKTGNMEYLYSIFKDREMKEFRTVKQLQKIYPAHQNIIKKYIKDNSIKFSDTQKVMDMIKYLETLEEKH